MGYTSYINDCDFRINSANYEEMTKNGIVLEDLENTFWVEFDIRVLWNASQKLFGQIFNNSEIFLKHFYVTLNIESTAG